MDNVREKRCKTGSKMPGGSLLPTIFLLVILLPGYPSLSVTWLPNLEWNTASNWADNLIPMNGTRVVFPVEMRLSVGLPAQNSPLDIAGIELPRDGALALSQNGLLTMSQAESSVKTAHWSLEGPLLWVDPNNWLSEKSSKAVPHLERIPCQDDVVVLPESKHTFSMQLPNTFGTKVQAIKVKDQPGNVFSWEWRKQIETRREFSSGPMSVGYTGMQSCLSCPCQPETIGREILEEVCKTRGANCGDLECEYPLEIEGHCCHYCGGRVLLPDSTSLSLAKTVANLALRNFGSTLSWYARRTWDSKTEILIAGKDAYSAINTKEGIATLKSVLQEQGIQALSLESAGAEVRISKWTAVMGPLLGTLLMIILLLLVAFPSFGYSLPQVLGEGWRGFRELINTERLNGMERVTTGVRESTLPRKPFAFAKFENAPESGVELATSSSNIVVAHPDLRGEEEEEEEEEDYDDEDGGGRFSNPLYRSGRRQPEVQTFAALQRIHDDVADEEVDLGIEP